jgi:hypothetical protein
VSPSFRKIAWITFSTDRSARKSDSPWRELAQAGPLAAGVLRDERLDDLGIDHRAPFGHRPDRRHEVVEILDPFLQEVGAPCAAALEELERVARCRVLAEDDHARVRVGLADPLGGPDAFVGVPGRHADVGDHDVGPLRIHGGEQAIEVLADRDDLEVRLRLQQPSDPLADQQVIVRDHDPERHGRRIRRCLWS